MGVAACMLHHASNCVLERGEEGGPGEDMASDLELFKVDEGGLRNRATKALLNFRGVDAKDGVSIRAHGDTKPRRAARRRTPRTRFVLERARRRRKPMFS